MRDPDIPIDQVSGVEERPQNRREWSGALRSLVLPVLIVAAIVGVLLYVDRLRGGSTPASDGYGIVTLPSATNTTGRAASSDVGRAAPDFRLRTPDGGELRLSDLRGHPVLVNFWASWCIPCRQEMPEIVRAWAAHRDGGLQVVAVDLQENADQVRGFAGEFGMTFPIAIDRTGAVASAWRIGGPIKGIPSSYFLDADGIVRARAFGPLTAQSLSDNLTTIGVQP